MKPVPINQPIAHGVRGQPSPAVRARLRAFYQLASTDAGLETIASRLIKEKRVGLAVDHDSSKLTDHDIRRAVKSLFKLKITVEASLDILEAVRQRMATFVSFTREDYERLLAASTP